MSERTETSARQGYHHGNLREALLEDAETILEEEGLPALSLRALARRAGVSQTAPYRHFADKEALLAAVAARGFRLLRDSLEDATDGATDPTLRLRRMARGYVRFASRHKALFRLMFGAARHELGHSDELADAGGQAYGVIAGAMAEHGGTEAASPSARAATLAAWSLVHGLATLVNEGVVEPDEPGADGLDALVDRVASHLRTAPAST